jgi:transcriptional regulator with XRE-family HTH domain
MYLNLKLCLLRLGLRQNQMAQAIQVDEALLSRIINGFREPTSSQRRMIAQFLQEDEEWLFSSTASIQRRLSADGEDKKRTVAATESRDLTR